MRHLARVLVLAAVTASLGLQVQRLDAFSLVSLYYKAKSVVLTQAGALAVSNLHGAF